MIEATVEELTPLIGTRPACRALGAAPAAIYRRRTPPAPRPARPRKYPGSIARLARNVSLRSRISGLSGTVIGSSVCACFTTA